MYINTLLSLVLIVLLTFSSTDNKHTKTQDIINNKNSTTMNSFVSIFEIPATDFSRAINFYSSILDIEFDTMEFGGMQIGTFPSEGHSVFGTIIQEKDYVPSPNGVTIYLNGGDDLQNIVDKIEQHGGKILVPKTAHADESGFFALFLDSEGNKLGLHSVN